MISWVKSARAVSITTLVPSLPVLLAVGVALVTGWATRRHCRLLLNEGVGLGDGGGYAVLILLEFTTCMIAVSVAVNL
jgi:hypothetical protein